MTCWTVNSMEQEIGENFTFSIGPQVYQIKKKLEKLKQEILSILTWFGKMKKFCD